MSYYPSPLPTVDIYKSSVKIPTDGFIQIPVYEDSKKALLYKWKDIATIDRQEIQRRFNEKIKAENIKNYRLGTMTGELNNIIVLDIDKLKTGSGLKDGMKMYRDLIKNDPPTLMFRSPSGGRHYYYKYDDDINVSSLAVNGYSIDVLSNGKYATVYSDVIVHAQIQPIPENVKEFVIKHQNEKRKKEERKTKPKEIENNIYIPPSIKYDYVLAEIDNFLNILPSKYYNDSKLWITITSALKSADLRASWVTFSKKSDTSYDENNNNNIWDNLIQIVDLTYLKIVKLREKIKTGLKIRRWCNKLNLFTTTPNETRNDKYITLVKSVKSPDIVNFDYDIHPYILIKSATGTGKTTCTADLIKKIRDGYDYNVLSIVSRISLAQQHKKNFNNNGIDIVSYQDISPGDYSKCKNLVIQVDSIIHLDKDKLKNTIVFLDEINSLFDYILNSSTLRSRRLSVYNMFCMIIQNASYIIGVDADLSDIVIKFFKNFDYDPYIIHNTYKNPTGKATQYIDVNTLVDDMKAKLLNDEKFICCFDSLTYQDKIKSELLEFCMFNNLESRSNDFLCYSSKDGDDNDLRDVTEKWKNKYVFYTPKIVYGVDFVPDVPTYVYAFFQCTSINPLGFSQMISRCRDIKHLRYYMHERNIELMYMNARDIKDKSDSIIQYLDKLCDTIDPITSDNKEAAEELKKRYRETDVLYMEYNPRTGEIEYKTDYFDEMFWQNQYYNIVMRSAMNYHFIEILKEKGYRIKINNDTTDNKLDMKKLEEYSKIEYDITVNNIIDGTDASLSESEKKVKKAMTTRAELLHIKINNETYREEIINDKKYISHLNVCSLLNTDTDYILINKCCKDMKVHNIKANALKLKLINEIQTILNVTPLCIADINYEGKIIPDDTKDAIKKVFRIKEVDIIAMYRNICPDLIKSSQVMKNKIRSRVYEVDSDLLGYHLDLLSRRDREMVHINKDILKSINYELPPVNKDKDT